MTDNYPPEPPDTPEPPEDPNTPDTPDLPETPQNPESPDSPTRRPWDPWVSAETVEDTDETTGDSADAYGGKEPGEPDQESDGLPEPLGGYGEGDDDRSAEHEAGSDEPDSADESDEDALIPASEGGSIDESTDYQSDSEEALRHSQVRSLIGRVGQDEDDDEAAPADSDAAEDTGILSAPSAVESADTDELPAIIGVSSGLGSAEESGGLEGDSPALESSGFAIPPSVSDESEGAETAGAADEPEAPAADDDDADVPVGIPLGGMPGREPARPADPIEIEEVAADPDMAAAAPIAPVASGAVDSPDGPVPPQESGLSGTTGGWVRWLLLLAMLIALASGVLLAGVHLNDRYGIDDAAGRWIGLARWVDEGVLYPPLYDEETRTYGGTRYMPLSILAHAGVAQFTGEYLMSGKIVACASAALMLLTTLIVLLYLRCPPLMALGLLGLVIVSPVGMQSITSIRGDALPVFIQLIAVLLMIRRGQRSIPVIVFVGLLCALAILAKLSAGWAALAIGLYLLGTNIKRLLFFAGSFVVWLGIAAGILYLVTKGVFFSEVLANAFGGTEALGERALLSPGRLLEYATEWAPICWALVPLAGMGLALRLSGKRLMVHHLSLLACLLVLLVVYADGRTGSNHVLDLLVLSAIAAGGLAGQVMRQKPGMAVPHGVLAMVVILGTPFMLLHKPLNADGRSLHVGADVVEAIGLLCGRDAPAEYDPNPIEGMIVEGRIFLSEDAYASVSIDHPPTVLDASLIKDLDQELIDALAERIRNTAFCKVVLLRNLEEDADWYREESFGQEIAAAIAEAYVLSPEMTEQAGGYYIYMPRVVVQPAESPWWDVAKAAGPNADERIENEVSVDENVTEEAVSEED